MLVDKSGRVAIWIGTIAKKSQFTAYMKEKYGDFDDETPISPFCADMGDTFYDHDFVFGEWSGTKPQPIEKILSGWNHAHTFLAGALKLATKAGIETGNTVMIAYDHELKPGKWPTKSPVRFLGNLAYSEEPPPLSTELTGVLGHPQSASRLCFAPDGKTLVSGSNDGTLMAWDALSGKPLVAPRYAFKGSLADIYDLHFTADGTRCVAATMAATCVWDPSSSASKMGKPILHFAAKAITPDGKLGLDAEIGKVSVYDLTVGKPAKGLHRKIAGNGFALLPGGRIVTTSGDEGLVRLWNLSTAKLLHSLPCPVPAREIVASPSGNWAVTYRNEQAIVWDLKKRSASKLISVGADIQDVLVPSDDCWIVCLRDQPLQQWKLSSGKLVRTLGAAKQGYRRLDAAAGKLLAVASNRMNVDLWDLKSGKSLGRYPNKTKVDATQLIDSGALSPDGATIAIGLRCGEVHFLRYTKGKFARLGASLRATT